MVPNSGNQPVPNGEILHARRCRHRDVGKLGAHPADSLQLAISSRAIRGRRRAWTRSRRTKPHRAERLIFKEFSELAERVATDLRSYSFEFKGFRCVLVTHNGSEFVRISGLKIEDWLAD